MSLKMRFTGSHYTIEIISEVNDVNSNINRQAKFLGIDVHEFFTQSLKYNGKYMFGSIYFKNEQDALIVLEWLEGILIMNQLTGV